MPLRLPEGRGKLLDQPVGIVGGADAAAAGMLMFVANLLYTVLYSFSYRMAMPTRDETKLVNIALQVLCAAGTPDDAIGGRTSVRLALRVLLEHLPSAPSLVEFWTIYDNPAFPTWPACRASYEMIVKQLQRAGFAIGAENVQCVASD